MSTQVAIATPVGELHGRDAIHLDHVDINNTCTRIVLRGAFNGTLASEPVSSKWVSYEISFDGVTATKITELEAWVREAKGNWPTSSFDQIIESAWINSLRGGESPITAGHRHYRFSTYDLVFEMICTGYELKVAPERPERGWPRHLRANRSASRYAYSSECRGAPHTR